ncbi:hypothetical protein AB7Y15_19440 [Morganella morganii]|uniref:hypothetical protein n=1 Tax=Morganella morganii TaxID=582 RepID=UPI0034E3B5F0
MEPTDFEKWCAGEMKCSIYYITENRIGTGYRRKEIHKRYRAYMAGVFSRLPYQTPPKGDEDGMD